VKEWAACLFLAVGRAWAAPAAGVAPADPNGLAWQQHPGAMLPLATSMTNEAGQAIALRDYFGKVPVILDLGYFHCPSLCGVVRADLFNALSNSGLTAGRDYILLAVSIDPAETPTTAAQARQTDHAQYAAVTGPAFHYLTASPRAIAAIADAVGFRYRYDARFQQYMHPSGLTILTSTGEVNGYLLGVGYTPGDLRAAVLRAGQGGIAQAALPVLLLCFHYDPTTGRYTLAIMKLLRLMALLTVGSVAALLLILHRGGRGARA
jgi:protein SCO1/2